LADGKQLGDAVGSFTVRIRNPMSGQNLDPEEAFLTHGVQISRPDPDNTAVL